MPQQIPQQLNTWHARLTSALSQDPKKTGVLGVLCLIMLIVSARMFVGSSHPSLAAGSAAAAPYAGAASAFVPSTVAKPGGAAASLRGWLSTPIPPVRRNDFLVRSDYFPVDTAKSPALSTGNSFWATLAKSLSVQADQKEKRDAAVGTLKLQAAALRPTSIVMGPSPRAMVDGVLVAEGDTVASFRVIKIEAHGIIIERQGVRLAVPMN